MCDKEEKIMEESSNKVLYIIVGIVAVLLVISFGFLIIRSALEKGNNLTTAVNDKMDNVLESQYTQYDAATISGSQVLNIISEVWSQTDRIAIRVVNKGGNTTTYCNAGTYTAAGSATLGTDLTNSAQSTAVTAAKTKGNAAYITPTGKFLGEVCRDSNEAIVMISFTQQ